MKNGTRLLPCVIAVLAVLVSSTFIPCRAVIAPKAVYDRFNDLVFDRIQEICDAGGTLNQRFASDGGGHDMTPKGEHTWDIYLIDGYCHDEQALIHESDSDALAVVLRRTEALLNHLKVMPGAPDVNALEQEFVSLKTQSAGVSPSNTGARRTLYDKVCDVRRKIAFANPLLSTINKLVFLEYDPIWSPHIHMCDQYFGCNAVGGGGLYVLDDPFGPNPQRRELPAGPVESGALAGTDLRGGGFLSPEVSYDGTEVYFAWTQAGDNCKEGWNNSNTYDIFKVHSDGTGLVQLTGGNGGAFWNDFDPCALPGGRVAFISERRTGSLLTFGRCHGGRDVPAYTLFSMKPDGSDMYPIAYHETNQWHPSVDNNGMIVFTQWDYVDRGSNEAHHLWTCYPDGRDPRAPHGNYDHPWGDHRTPYNKSPIVKGQENGGFHPSKGGSCLHPWGEWNIRGIPGSHKYIATAAPHHGVAFGSLVLIDTRIEDDGMMSQVRRVTPNCLFPEAERDEANNPFYKELGLPHGWHMNMRDYYHNGKYGTAWPLNEDFYICNYWKHLILLDRYGNKEVLYTLDWDNTDDFRVGYRPVDPIPLHPREKPPVLAQRTFDGEDMPDKHPRATISIQNIYETYPVPWPEGVVEEKKIKWMRIVQFIPKTTPGENNPRVGNYDMATCRMSLGIVPVEDDGSVYCNAPVNKPIYFQALDRNQMAIQSMRSLTYVHTGEQLSCVGCHESKWKAIPPLTSTPIAFQRAPSPIEEEFPGHHSEPTKGAIPFNYHLLAKPALQRAGYGGEYKHCWAPGGGSRSIPGHVGAHKSRIGTDLVGKYTSGAINEEDFHRIVMWLDLNANELGWDHDVEAQKAGQVVWPEIDVDRDNVLGTEHWLPAPESLQTSARFPGHGGFPTSHRVKKHAPIEIIRTGSALRISAPAVGALPVEIWDARGSMVFRRTYGFADGSIRVPLSSLPQGIYVVRVAAPAVTTTTRTISTLR